MERVPLLQSNPGGERRVDTLLKIHGDVRWVIVLVAAIALIRLIWGLVREKPYDRMTQRSVMAFSTVLDIEVLLGIVCFIWDGAKYGNWPQYRIEHGITMLIALMIAHLSTRWRRAPAPIRFRNDLAAVSGTMLVILIGVARLPGPDRWLQLGP
jgi:hypothetical protein